MSDVWGSFNQGYGIGSEMGATDRNARAYRDGGLTVVADAAGRTGDLPTMMATRRFQDDQTQAAYQRMETIAPWALNVVRATRSMDPARARAFLQQNSQRFLDFGFSPEQLQAGIDGLTSEDPATRDQWQQQLGTAFSQHRDPNWQIMDYATGEIGGVDPNTGDYVQGGNAPANAGQEWRAMTPEELQQAGAPAGTMADINVRTGERRVRRNPPAGHAGAANGSAPSLPPGFTWEQ